MAEEIKCLKRFSYIHFMGSLHIFGQRRTKNSGYRLFLVRISLLLVVHRELALTSPQRSSRKSQLHFTKQTKKKGKYIFH